MKEIHFICFPQSSISGVCTSPAFRCLIGLSMGATAWLIARYHLSPYVFDSHYTQKLVFESLWRLNKHLETCAGSQWSCHADPTTDCRALPSYSSAEVLILCLQQALHACSSLLCWHVACPRVLHRCHQTEILMHLRLLVTPVIWCEQVLARSPQMENQSDESTRVRASTEMPSVALFGWVQQPGSFQMLENKGVTRETQPCERRQLLATSASWKWTCMSCAGGTCGTCETCGTRPDRRLNELGFLALKCYWAVAQKILKRSRCLLWGCLRGSIEPDRIEEQPDSHCIWGREIGWTLRCFPRTRAELHWIMNWLVSFVTLLLAADDHLPSKSWIWVFALKAAVAAVAILCLVVFIPATDFGKRKNSDLVNCGSQFDCEINCLFQLISMAPTEAGTTLKVSFFWTLAGLHGLWRGLW